MELNEALISTYTFPELCEQVFDALESGKQSPVQLRAILIEFLNTNTEFFNNSSSGDMDHEYGERLKVGQLIHTLGHYERMAMSVEEYENLWARTGEDKSLDDKKKLEDLYSELKFWQKRVEDSVPYKMYRLRESERKKEPLYAVYSLIESACNVTDVAEIYQAKEALENIINNR